MRQILISSLGIALLLAIAGCKSSGSGDSMGSMKMDSDAPMSKPATTMPATMPM